MQQENILQSQTNVAPPTAEERKLVLDFNLLVEESKSLFNGLRDLPQYGQRQWQPYFAKTFETYTKLWKFQQENRQILDKVHELKRWQIGEIANKIGQLYYHYYLRTSESNYLNEAYHFYSAIRTRHYYKRTPGEFSAEIILKKHRYYARFIVVCLLLDLKKDTSDLVVEFAKQVDENKILLEHGAGEEWTQVVSEIKSFVAADPCQVLTNDTYQRVNYNMRLTPQILPPLDNDLKTHVSLGDAVIVGNSPSQVKFSELTIDMFRMVQVLERKPEENKKSESKENSKRINPHKYLLYRPTFFQLFTVLSTAVKELPAGQGVLLYLSALGSVPSKVEETGGYEAGGVITNDRREDNNNNTQKHASSHIKEMHCFHPADIIPLTRKPILLIIDSDNSRAFAGIPSYFGQPVICLMAPEHLPHRLQETQNKGRLLTLFLYSPLIAFMHVCGLDQITDRIHDTCQHVIHKALEEAQRAYLRSRTLDHSFLQLFGDDFFRLILLRFAFCYCVLNLHRAFKNESFYPTCHPVLPTEDFVGNPSMNKAICDMAGVLGVKNLFLE